MNIDRHNYETFFLLYIDNELPNTEKELVEEFVRENSDLQEEFTMLQQSIVMPDEVVFDDKEALHKNQFDTSGLQEKLFLHLDNELSFAEGESLEERINGDKDLKKEWSLLLQTKLVADDSIVFASKEVLYRKEGGKVIAFPWMKLAVAAVFIVFIVWGGIAYVNNRPTVDKGMASNNNPQTTNKAIKINKQPVAPSPKPAIVEKKEDEKQLATVKPAPASTPIVKKLKPLEKEIVQPKEMPEPQPIAKLETNSLPEPYSNNINKNDGNKTITTTVLPQMQATNNDPGNHVIEDKVNKAAEPANSFAVTTASLNETSEENHDRILFMDEEKVKKTKLGGFLRKATRVLERNTKIKPGSNRIKVANLEFAIQ